MRHLLPCAVAVLFLFICTGCLAQDRSVVGHWRFDGNLQDSSTYGNHASGAAPEFGAGQQGQAVALDGKRLEVPDSPELDIAPGIVIDCWVYFDKRPESYEHLVQKNEEYQIRVDHPKEGGSFAFFVYLNGAWEPRIRGPQPKVGQWQHLVARWTGTQTILEVDGEVSSTHRAGVPTATDNPVAIGGVSGRIDELKISNPSAVTHAAAAELIKSIPDDQRIEQTRFGSDAGWEGWRADWGGAMALENGKISAQFAEATAMLMNPMLNVDVTSRTLLSVDIASESADSATLVFSTDEGQGSVAFHFWGPDRTTIIDMGPVTQWAGKLKFLGIAFPDSRPGKVSVENLYISEKPEGKPYVYVRNLAPWRAIPRAGREEKIVATLRSLGKDASDVSATLTVPPGVQVLDEATRTFPVIAHEGTLRIEWTVKTDTPVSGLLTVAATAPGMKKTEKSVEITFAHVANFARADYVPEPKPAKTPYNILMHYCALWKFGTHYGWNKIEDWPDRRPALGWYDEGTPEVSDWQIKYALEHGIQAFIYCWYRSNWGPDVKHTLGHAIHDGLKQAKYRDMFDYCIMWENGCAKGVQSVDDMMDNLLPYWIENYFTDPNYLIIDNKPVLFVWRPERVAAEVGGSENVKVMLDRMRAQMRKLGFDGLYVIGCVTTADEPLLTRMAEEGWDYSSAYGLDGPTTQPPGIDEEGTTTVSHKDWISGQKKTLLEKKRIGALPDIVDVMAAWDPRPWHGNRTTSYKADVTVDAFRDALETAKEIADSNEGDGLDSRCIVLDNWCEFGEGHYIEPVTGLGFSFVDAVRDVFCEPGPHEDIIPEDVGLESPEHVFAKYREIMAGRKSRAERVATGDLVAWWKFDEEDENLALDSSGAGISGFKRDFVSAPGIDGGAFLCDGGSVAIGADPSFWPSAGITIEVWCKTDVPDQSDRWIINTVGGADTGYRLGMGGGKIAWQIPETAWSHMVTTPEPIELGKWTHVAATYDNRMMRIYINGELKAEMERGARIRPSDTSLTIGSYTSGHPTAFFKGLLDELRIYNRPLSGEEVAGRYNETKPAG